MEYTVIPQLSFSEALNASTSKITQFTGRSRRSEYWWTMALVYMANIVLTPFAGFVLDLLTIPLTFRRLHDIGKSGWWYGGFLILKGLFFISLIYDMVMYFIYIHNVYGNEGNLVYSLFEKYGIWLLAIAIYQIILFILFCLDSEKCENGYGVSPKYRYEEMSN